MHRQSFSLLLAALAIPICSVAARPSETEQAARKLPVKVYREKMKAGWIGQIAGVSWGGPTEFKWKDQIIPADKMPVWKPEMINHAFNQDDLYVEMTFLRTLEQYGLGCSIRQAGIDFANSGYPLWCANNAGRTNLRKGIAPPDSSHPDFNRCPNDIDYQIEADFSGLIAPGIPQAAVDLGEKFGRLMNYGDGMYAGQFMGAMYAEAFFSDDPVQIARKALKAIPADCQYAEMVRDLLAWFQENPNDWEAAWAKCQKKYREDPAYQKASNGGIDCKINGAYVLLGLLYGKRDPDATIVISCRSGMDSDCNPSSSAGVLFSTIGFSNLPARFRTGLDEEKIFSHTAYNIPALLDVCEKLARQIVVKYGGSIQTDSSGEEFFLIPDRPVQPSKLELSWAPGPVAASRFTAEEMSQIVAGNAPPQMKEAVAQKASGWRIRNCGTDMDPGLLEEWAGKKNVLLTHPLDESTGCVLHQAIEVPQGKKTTLHLLVSHHPKGDFELIVRAGEKELLREIVGPSSAPGQWYERTIDLSSFAGKKFELELVNQPNGWQFEAAYWADFSVSSE